MALDGLGVSADFRGKLRSDDNGVAGTAERPAHLVDDELDVGAQLTAARTVRTKLAAPGRDDFVRKPIGMVHLTQPREQRAAVDGDGTVGF